jgi:hypothetical protein
MFIEMEQNEHSTPAGVAPFAAISGAGNIEILRIPDKIYQWAIVIGEKARSLKLLAFLPTHRCKRDSTAGANLVLVPLLQTILLCCCGIKSFLFLQNKA